MAVICWSAKGGNGTTLVAVSLALSEPQPGLIVDLAGDVLAALGLPEHDAPGALDWVASDASVDRLDELVVATDVGLGVLPAGDTTLVPDALAVERWRLLAQWCAAEETALARPVVIDAGRWPPPEQLRTAGRSILVTRTCYLALRAARRCEHEPDGIVVVREPGRLLSERDVERSLGAAVVATVPWDPAIQRSLDAGLLASRPPQSVRKRLGAVTRLAGPVST